MIIHIPDLQLASLCDIKGSLEVVKNIRARGRKIGEGVGGILGGFFFLWPGVVCVLVWCCVGGVVWFCFCGLFFGCFVEFLLVGCFWFCWFVVAGGFGTVLVRFCMWFFYLLGLIGGEDVGDAY